MLIASNTGSQSVPERVRAAAILLSLVLAIPAGTVLAQSKGGGKIICWKDKSGKTVGCGDTVPPEYQDSATKELDKRGVTRSTTESAEAVQMRKAQEAELARRKEEEKKRLAEQKRQDAALLSTYASEKEIDAKRDRDVQVVELQISQFRVSLKNATDRQAELKARSDNLEKTKKPVPDSLKDEIARTAAERQKIEAGIAAREKEKEDIQARYAGYKKRFAELTGGQPAAPSSPAAGPAPKK